MEDGDPTAECLSFIVELPCEEHSVQPDYKYILLLFNISSRLPVFSGNYSILEMGTHIALLIVTALALLKHSVQGGGPVVFPKFQAVFNQYGLAQSYAQTASTTSRTLIAANSSP